VFIAYLTGVYFFKVEPLSFAGGLTALLTPYLAAESFTKSKI